MRFSNKSSILVECASYAEQEEMSKDISSIFQDSNIAFESEKMDDGETKLYSRFFDIDITTDEDDLKRNQFDLICNTATGSIYNKALNVFEYEKNVDVRDYLMKFVLDNRDRIAEIETSDIKFSIKPNSKFSIAVIATHKSAYDLCEDLATTFTRNGVFYKKGRSNDELNYFIETTLFKICFYYTSTELSEFHEHIIFDGANKVPVKIRSDFKGKKPKSGESYKKYVTDILTDRPLGYGFSKNKAGSVDWLK